jgi:hypothetical protein
MEMQGEYAFHDVGAIGAQHVYRVDSGIYLVRLAGYLSRPDVDAIGELISRDNKSQRRAVLYEVSADFNGYDPELRRTTLNSPTLRGTTHIGIITSNTMLRMVTATVALGLRAAMGIPMKTYATVAAAVAGARAAMRSA